MNKKDALIRSKNYDHYLFLRGSKCPEDEGYNSWRAWHYNGEKEYPYRRKEAINENKWTEHVKRREWDRRKRKAEIDRISESLSNFPESDSGDDIVINIPVVLIVGILIFLTILILSY